MELVNDRRSFDLGGPRQRTVLSLLALNANRVVPVEQLIDAVWDTSPPSTARAQIQTSISALRKLLAEAGSSCGVIVRRSPGYALEIAPGELDSLQFGALVAKAREQVDAGDEADATLTLGTALGLWRGAALSGVTSELVQRGATLLEDRRMAALDERIRLDLVLGRHEELSGELRTLVAEHPLREKLHGFLMLALYRAGRQAEALEAARHARTVLVEEIGIDPGQELQDLERAILHRDAALDLPSAAVRDSHGSGREAASPLPAPGGPSQIPQQLPASISDFTGRDEQLREITALLTTDSATHSARWGMPIIAISGKGGSGKSCLAIRAAHELSAHFPDGQLYADLSGSGGEDRTARLLARFLRALGVAGSAVPDDTDERMELYRSKVSGKRLLLVLDDVPAAATIRPLLPGSPTCAVITTSRERLGSLSGAHWVDVGMLDVDRSAELLTRIVGPERVRAEDGAVVELVGFCGGLPLALRIAGARLASRPHWQIGGLVRRLRDEARRLDELAYNGLELRSNIGLTYRILTEPAQRLFRLFALVEAPDFPGWTAAALLDSSLGEAEEVLESLVDAQLLDVVKFPGSQQSRYRFHALIRVYAREKLLEAEPEEPSAAALTRLLGAWLALAEEAHRKEYGGDYTILHGRAPRWRPPRGEAPDAAGDPAEWWEAERGSLVAAVRQAAHAGLDELCWDLALTSVTLFEMKGYFDDWLECALTAREAAERAGNRTGTAAMQYSLGTLHMFQTRLDSAEECFTIALGLFRALDHAHGCALVLRNAAHIDELRGDVAAMRAKYAESLETMRAVGDRIGEAHILRSLASDRMSEGDTAAARQLLEEALAICREAPCLRAEAQVVHRFAELHLATHRMDLARQALNRVLRIVRDTGDRIGEAYAVYGLGVLRHREGRTETAEMTLTHALGLSRRLGEQLIEAKALYTLGEIAAARGDDAVGVAHLTEADRLFGELGSVLMRSRTLILLSDIRAAAGRTGPARADLEQAVRLLAANDSREAAHVLAELRAARSALPADRRADGAAGAVRP
ncbi:AfsR/SARP family transcriptional regulator [Streptomyces sodiiphilus]|uniref:AfsR/SARP family transcriptional regulator n=1 Tax=Streptomyces sodiiphilus TaxID=226217 RepID=UPI0031E42523